MKGVYNPINRKILIIIPTFNEIKNIRKLIEEIDSVSLKNSNILFIDDASPDGTGELIDEIALKRGDIFVMHRQGRLGLGTAYREGFKYALSKAYDYIFEMDADLSHNPEYLFSMMKELESSDVVIGSRFMGERNNINVTPFRILLSIAAARYLNFLLGIKCLDSMAGFIGYRRKVLESLDFSRFFTKGYAFQAEMKFNCQKKGFKISEIPIVFKKRRLGDSRINKRDVLEALALPWRIKFFNDAVF